MPDPTFAPRLISWLTPPASGAGPWPADGITAMTPKTPDKLKAVCRTSPERTRWLGRRHPAPVELRGAIAIDPMRTRQNFSDVPGIERERMRLRMFAGLAAEPRDHWRVTTE